MHPFSLEGLEQYLNSLELPTEIQADSGQTLSNLDIEGGEFPLFGRVFEEQRLIQLLCFLPTRLEPEAIDDTARLLHILNRELDLPGFGMDEDNQIAFFRVMIPRAEGDLPEKEIETLIQATILVMKTFAPAVVAVASKAASLKDILEKAEQMRQQAGNKPDAAS